MNFLPIFVGIEGKLTSITVDNATYNDVAIKSIRDSISATRSLSLRGNLFHVRCCAHILNLLVQDGVKEISGIIENVRDSVKFISASETRLKLFSELAKTYKLPNKRLILDCTTRWNATYQMLATTLEFRAVITNHCHFCFMSKFHWLSYIFPLIAGFPQICSKGQCIHELAIRRRLGQGR